MTHGTAGNVPSLAAVRKFATGWMLPSCPCCCTVVKPCSGFQYPGMGGYQ